MSVLRSADTAAWTALLEPLGGAALGVCSVEERQEPLGFRPRPSCPGVCRRPAQQLLFPGCWSF